MAEDKDKVVFLDRDGVINEYPGDSKYVTSRNEFKFIAGSIEAIRKLNEHEFKMFIVSNQQGVAKGVYSQEELDAITQKMLNGLKKRKATVHGIYYCTHLKEEECVCRKPKTGFLDRIYADFNLKPKTAYFVGDSIVDVETARNFGVKSVLVLSGREKLSYRDRWRFLPDFIFDNLLLASHYICAHAG